MKTKANPGGSLRGFTGALTDPRTGKQLFFSTLRQRNALAVLATDPDIVDSPTTEVVAWTDDRGDHRRELIAVKKAGGGKVFFDAVSDSDATSPQRVCDNAAIARRLAERSTASVQTFTDSMARRGDAIANADELLATGRMKPSTTKIWTVRAVLRDAGGAMTIGALAAAGFTRRLILALVCHRHLVAERGRRFTNETLISLSH